MRSVLLSVAKEITKKQAQKLRKSKTEDFDIISGVAGTTTHFGRPDWQAVFGELEEQHPGENIGVFYCGPAVVANALKQAGAEYTARGITRFSVHKENF